MSRTQSEHSALQNLDGQVAVVAVSDLCHAAVRIEEARAVLDLVRRDAVQAGELVGALARVGRVAPERERTVARTDGFAFHRPYLS